MIKLFEEEKSAVLFVDNIMEKYKRYARDQFMVLEESAQTYPEEREAALNYCIENGLWSANNFRDVAAYLSQQNQGNMLKEMESSCPAVSSGIQVATRSINEYLKILGGEGNE